MKELDKQILPRLISIYSTYLLHGSEDKLLQAEAREMYNSYQGAWSLMSKDVANAHSSLFGIGYPEQREATHTPIMTKEDAQKILKTLKKYETKTS